MKTLSLFFLNKLSWIQKQMMLNHQYLYPINFLFLSIQLIIGPKNKDYYINFDWLSILGIFLMKK